MQISWHSVPKRLGSLAMLAAGRVNGGVEMNNMIASAAAASGDAVMLKTQRAVGRLYKAAKQREEDAAAVLARTRGGIARPRVEVAVRSRESVVDACAGRHRAFSAAINQPITVPASAGLRLPADPAATLQASGMVVYATSIVMGADGTWPASTSSACHYDSYPFSGPPRAFAYALGVSKWLLSGCYCSWACAIAEAEDAPGDPLRSASLHPARLTRSFARAHCGYPPLTRMQRAAPKAWLRRFGGTMEIEEWRALPDNPELTFRVLNPVSKAGVVTVQAIHARRSGGAIQEAAVEAVRKRKAEGDLMRALAPRLNRVEVVAPPPVPLGLGRYFSRSGSGGGGGSLAPGLSPRALRELASNPR